MNYTNLVRRPFEIVARRPYLWLLGLLAGGATTYSYSGGSNYRTSAGGPTFSTIQNFWAGNWEWIAILAATIAVIGIVLFVLGCIATGGIIHAAVEHDDGKDYRLGTAWRAGYKTGWRIAGIKLTTLVLALAAAIIVGGLAAAAALSTGFVPAAVIFALLTAVTGLAAVVFWILLGIACELGERIIVLEDGRVFDSLAAGFRLSRAHFREVGLGWLILVVVSIAAGIAIAIAVVAIAIPAVALGLGGWVVGGQVGAVVSGSFAAVFFLGALLAVSGLYAAYSSVYWTLLYRTVRALPATAPRGAIVPAA